MKDEVSFIMSLILLVELLLLALAIAYVELGLLLLIGILALFSGCGILFYSIKTLHVKRRRRYEEIADEWLANNRVLKVEEVVFILFNRDTWTIESFVCAGRDDFCHRVMMDRWVLGKMIKKRKKELQKVRYVRKISKERLIRSIRISSYFDKEWWSKVDIRLFPEWLTAELVARELSED